MVPIQSSLIESIFYTVVEMHIAFFISQMHPMSPVFSVQTQPPTSPSIAPPQTRLLPKSPG